MRNEHKTIWLERRARAAANAVYKSGRAAHSAIVVQPVQYEY